MDAASSGRRQPRRSRALGGPRLNQESSSPDGKSYREWLGAIAGATTLFGALLYYFGWARTSAAFGYFGIQTDVLGLSFQDYLLRSIRSAYQPLLVVAVLLLVGFGLRRVLDRPGVSVPAAMSFMGLGGIAVLVGVAAVAGLVTFTLDWPLVPALLLGGTVLCVTGASLRGWARLDGRRPGAPHALIAATIVLLSFWLVSSYATYLGTGAGASVAKNLEQRPSVVVLSQKSLALHGTGVRGTVLAQDAAAFRYCYSGLRLLIRAGGRLFLLPEGWTSGRDPVIVLPEDASTRFEYARAPSPHPCG